MVSQVHHRIASRVSTEQFLFAQLQLYVAVAGLSTGTIQQTIIAMVAATLIVAGINTAVTRLTRVIGTTMATAAVTDSR